MTSLGDAVEDMDRFGRPEPEALHKQTVSQIERDIADAQSALLRRLGGEGEYTAPGRAGTVGPRAQRLFSHERSAPARAEGDDEVEQRGRSSRPPSISDSRRRQILAQLANERAERRGFASERELVLTQVGGAEAPAPAARAGGPAGGTRGAPAPRDAASIEAAIQEAASAAVSTALDRALASLGRGGAPAVAPSPERPTRAAPHSPGDIASPSRGSAGAVPPSPSRPPPAVPGSPAASAARDREALIARLLAERRAKLRADKDGAGGGSGGQAPLLAIPPVPPVVAALQAQAKAAAQAAVSAAADAAEAAVRQQRVRATIAQQQAALASVAGEDEGVAGLVAPEALPTPPSPSPPGRTRGSRVKFTRPSGEGEEGEAEQRPRFVRPSKADIEAERRRVQYGECTFQPRSASPAHLSADRLAELARTKAEEWQARERTREGGEEARLREECTFQPNATYDEDSGVVVGRDGTQFVPAPRAGSRGRSRSRSPVAASAHAAGDRGERGVLADAAADAARANALTGRRAGGARWAGSVAGTAPLAGADVSQTWDESRAKAYLESKPAAAVRARSVGGGRGVRAPVPAPSPPVDRSAVVNRLHGEADRRAVARIKTKAALEQASIAQFSFKPLLNPASLALVNRVEEDVAAGGGGSARGKPLHERSAALARAHEQHMHRLRVEAALSNPELTFKPRINSLSEKLASARAGEGEKDVPASTASTRRLLAEAAASDARKESARRSALKSEAAACTFAPRVLPASGRILEAKLRGMGLAPETAAALGSGQEGGEAFLSRQRLLGAEAAKNRAALEAEVRANEGCTFSPDIGNAEEILAITRPEMVTESGAGRVVRLAQADAEAQAKARADANAAYYGQFSYAPVLNPASRARGRVLTTDELHKDDAGARLRMRAAAVVEAQFKAEHPFQPTLVSRPLVSSSSSDAPGPLRLAVATDPEHVSDRILAHERAREAKREAARKLAEYEAMEGCTFTPDTAQSARSLARAASAVAEDGGVVVVRGLGRHLELREMQRKLEEERRCVPCVRGFALLPLRHTQPPPPPCLPLQRARGGGLRHSGRRLRRDASGRAPSTHRAGALPAVHGGHCGADCGRRAGQGPQVRQGGREDAGDAGRSHGGLLALPS